MPGVALFYHLQANIRAIDYYFTNMAFVAVFLVEAFKCRLLLKGKCGHCVFSVSSVGLPAFWSINGVQAHFYLLIIGGRSAAGGNRVAIRNANNEAE